MTMLIRIGSSKSLLLDVSEVEKALLAKKLTYTNSSVGYQIYQNKKKLKWARSKGYSDKAAYFEAQIAELEKKHHVTLAKPVGAGLEMPTGLLARVRGLCPEATVVDDRIHPKKSAGFPAVSSLAKLRSYQLEQLDACLRTTQGTIVSATGTGKTVVIQELLRKLGRPALLVVPSVSIMDQTIKRFEAYFGRGRVGQYGDGKKQIRDITIACAPSILKSKPSDWDDRDILLFDECHHVACETIERICYEFVPKAFYRFGFTATNFRADGADLAIEGGVFPSIHEYSVQQGIADGYLATPIFVSVKIDQSSSDYSGDDFQKAYQAHVIRNSYLNTIVVNQVLAVLAKNKQVVLLVKEKEHGHLLWKLLKEKGVATNFARTKESKDERLDLCPWPKKPAPPKTEAEEIQQAEERMKLEAEGLAPWVDPTTLVLNFNAKKERCLIGTSVIGEGTDLIPVDALFLLSGGASKGIVVQNVGRGLRLCPDKHKVLVFDFAIDVQSGRDQLTEGLAKHAAKRAEWFEEIGQLKKIDGRAFFSCK
jgi:superfamily II DNA or RNA helicase